MGVRRIGELLVAEGLLPESAIHRALGFQRLSGERIKLGSILLDWDLLAEEALLATLSKHYRCPSVDWAALSAASIEAVRMLPRAQAIRLGAIPFEGDKGTLRVAFLDPSNLAVMDEISAITGKRVAPHVTTEVRLMQAHQKFYGRHIPGAFRTILQKLGRRATRTRGPAPIAAVDFRAPDLVASSGTAVPVAAASELESLSLPEMPLFPDAAAPMPEPPPRPETARMDPVVPMPAEPALALPAPPRVRPAAEHDDPIRSGEDPLTEWVGEALASFQQDRPSSGSSSTAARAEASAAKANAVASAPSSEEVASGMWNAPARPEEDDEDEVARGMWTADDEPPRLWEARSREEIGDAVLQNALTHLPRVVLFGSGKTTISGWRGRAPDVSDEDLAAVRIPLNARSVFATVLATGAPHFGPVERSDWPAPLGSVLGKEPPDCAVFPIRVFDGVAAFLYADRAGQPMQYTDFALIARAAASTANVLARFLHRSSAAPVA